MSRFRNLLAAAILCLFLSTPAAFAEKSLELTQVISLPNVEGRIDHLAFDPEAKRLFVAALGNDSLEVVDLNTKDVRSIKGFHEPQGVLYVQPLHKLYVSNGGTGEVFVLNAKTFDRIKTIPFSSDADNLRYDEDTQKVFVGYENSLGIINPVTDEVVGCIPLGGHPEAFSIGRDKIFVNVPGDHKISVIDKKKQLVIANWLLRERSNFPMSMDELGGRLFVGTRSPKKLIVFDSEKGNKTAELESMGDVDDIFYDPNHKLIYLSGGEGFVYTFERKEADHYVLLDKIPTNAGARTSCFDVESGDLFLAVPKHATQKAQIKIYKTIGRRVSI